PAIQERIAPMVSFEGTRRVLNKELVKYRFSYQRTKGDSKEYAIDTVAVMPVEDIWSKDFPNAQFVAMDANYFNHEAFDFHPVVGVTWRQARAYTDWKGKQIMANIGNSYLSG